jgi:hypothetical protein
VDAEMSWYWIPLVVLAVWFALGVTTVLLLHLHWHAHRWGYRRRERARAGKVREL